MIVDARTSHTGRTEPRGSGHRTNLSRRIEGLDKDLEDETFCAGYGKSIEVLRQLLFELMDKWPEVNALDAAAQDAAQAQKIVDKITYAGVEFCAADDLTKALDGLHVGKSLNIDEQEFAQNLRTAFDRDKLVKYLKGNESRIDNGVVDVASHLAYRTPKNVFAKISACVAPLLFFAAGAGLLLFVSRFDNWGFGPGPNWPLSHGAPLLGAYLLVTGGVIVHLLVENLQS